MPATETNPLTASIRACLGIESRIDFIGEKFELGPNSLEGVYALGVPLQVEGSSLGVGNFRLFYSGGLLKDAPLSGSGSTEMIPLEQITSLAPTQG